eukprot:7161335-Alexandrium_andersonii.AAC.1
MGLSDLHVMAAVPAPTARASTDKPAPHVDVAGTSETARKSTERASLTTQGWPAPVSSDNPPDCSDP